MKKTLYICSLGLRFGQLTPETATALKRCGAVFSHCLESGPVALVVRSFCPDLRPLVGIPPSEIPRVVLSYLENHRTAAFLTYGNPFFLNEAASILKLEAEKAGVAVESLPGISSFDAIVALLPLDELPRAGLRIVHAGLCGGELEFSPEMATLFFMPDNLNRPERTEHHGEREKFLRRASAAYPPGHPALLVRAPSMDDPEGSVLRFTVARLGAALRRADRRTTLYLPALSRDGRRRRAALYKRA